MQVALRRQGKRNGATPASPPPQQQKKGMASEDKIHFYDFSANAPFTDWFRSYAKKKGGQKKRLHN